MPLPEKNYLIFCLKTIHDILNDQKKQTEAIQSLTEGNKEDERYLTFCDKLGAQVWPKVRKLNLNAAVFEAQAQATRAFCQNEDDIIAIQAAYERLLDQHLKPIITKVPRDGCLNTLSRLLAQTASSLQPQPLVGTNQYAWFAAAAGVVVIATLIAQNGPPGSLSR